MLTKFPFSLTLLILISLFQSHVALATKKSYIVYLGEHSHGPEITTTDLRRVKESHHNFLASFLGSKAKAKEAIFYSYNRVINGFAAVLEEKEVADIAKHPEVLSIIPNEGLNLYTTRSWDFLLNLENDGVIPPDSIWNKTRFGEDSIIGNIDTGVWPESKSFNDEGLGPIPSKWKGICQNDNAANFTCNRAACKEGALDPEKVKGKILVCERSYFYWDGMGAVRAGAVGLILQNGKDYGLERDAVNYTLPATWLDYPADVPLLKYLNSTIDPKGYITPPTTELHTKPAPMVEVSSSRGPNTITPEILKPDIVAPGYNIIAAFSEDEPQKINLPYFMYTGTSMACPHISGVVGLLKTLHPEWSPAAIRSAIMTTASTTDNTGKPILDFKGVFGIQQATPFSYGAGHVQPNQAMDPGLVYDLTINDYLNFICHNKTDIKAFTNGTYQCPEKIDLLSFNNPAITVPELGSGSIIVSRTLKNVGGPGNYTASIQSPDGISVSVDPVVLQFDKIGDERTFKLIIKALKPPVSSLEEDVWKKVYVFGSLTWSDGHHLVRSPISVSRAPHAE